MGASKIAAREDALRGALYVLAAGLCWSFTGIFLRLAPHFDPWQFLAWRSLGTASAIAIVARLSGHGPLTRRLMVLGRPGAVVTLAFAVASITFIVSMKTTTVANALFLSSCAPLIAAVLGYFVLGERLSLWQTASIALGLAGLLVIVGGGLAAGSLIGNVCAVATALGFAGASVMMRLGRVRDFSPAIFGYGIAACVFSALVCFAEGASLVSPLADALAALAGGLLPMGLGFACFLRGAPRVPAAAQTVLAQTETIFGPIWVWLAFGEAPGRPTLIGGLVILAAVVSMAAASSAAPRLRAKTDLDPKAGSD
jgi:drug/metabolite transporter (DMT)-like permease